MAARATGSPLNATADRRWLLRGAAAGAGAMVLGVIFMMVLIAVIVGDGSVGWADHMVLAGVVVTCLVSLVAAAAGAVGTWQAAAGGAPHQSAARLAGALGPASLIVLVTLAPLDIDGPGVAVRLMEAVVEVAAAIAGAAVLARRLDPV